MKKRILAFVLTLAMMASVLTMFASAVPYSPSANAWKDFNQEHNYIYEVKTGQAAPFIDGYVTEEDGYGKPIASYGFRYTTTADKYRDDLDQGEYKLKDNGSYYVYPTQDTPDEIWNSIDGMETDNPFGYIYTYYQQCTAYTTAALYYHNDSTGNFARAYKLTPETFQRYEAKDSAGNYILATGTVQTLTGEPVDWETNFGDYYTKVSSAYKPVEPTADGKAPAWKASTYYHGERIVVDRLYYRRSAGSNNSVGRVAWLKRDHTFVPEEVNLYARYDEQYLYYAIEVYEPEHENIYYNNSNYWGTTMSNSPGVFTYNYDFANYYRKNLTEDFARSNKLESIRTYVSAGTALNSSSYVYILAKFGNPEADYQKCVLSGVDYNITHTPRPVEEETPEEDDGLGFEDGGLGLEEPTYAANGIREDLRSGTYGTTVYEYRIPWTVINGKYSPDTCTTAVPEMFTVSQSIQLDNNVGRDTHTLTLSMPKYVYNAPSSFGKTNYLFRHPDATGLKNNDETFGTYNFYWRCVSGLTIWDVEAFTTDYVPSSKSKVYAPAHVLPVFFTAGQEPEEGYVQPEYAGENIRVDGSDAQKLRIKINVPKTDKEIAEVGAIVAPTEVVRNIQLRLGISSVAYYAFENPVLYGIVDGKWVNLTTDADKHFATSATPGDSDSFISYEEFGGKKSGVYTVHTLPVADLSAPYSSSSEGDVYTVVYGGANGEGIYNDFDDFNSFYTIRPYIRYADGTVTYGEHEYKSIYYIACHLIQPMLVDYNTAVVGVETNSQVDKKYNMDRNGLVALTDSSGENMLDKNGNIIYIPATTGNNTYSPYAGNSEYSIYLDARRQQVFLWHAIRTVGRRNANTPLRLEDYENFDANTKLLVQQYMDMYEAVWNIIESAESNRYITKVPVE